MTLFRTLCAAALAWASLTGGAWAQAIVSTGQSFVEARLVPGLREADGSRIVGLRLSMADGWKTYWRSPGEAGIPPVFEWGASDNIDRVEVMWPRPEIFQSFGMRTIGYSHQVVLPIRLVPRDAAQPMRVGLTAHVGVCRDICVLEQVDLAETIGADTPEIGARQVRRAMAEVPPVATEAGLSHATCAIGGRGAERDLAISLGFDAPLRNPVVLLESTEDYWIRRDRSWAEPHGVDASAEMVLSDGVSWLDRGSLRMTVLADGFAADVRGCTAPAR